MGFVFKTTQPAFIASELRRKHFDRNLASETNILGQVDLAHSAGSEHGNNFVMRQQRAGSDAFVTFVVHDLLRRFEHRLGQEIRRFVGGLQQRLHFFSQLRVAAAVLVEKLRARFRLQLERLIKQAFDLRQRSELEEEAIATRS